MGQAKFHWSRPQTKLGWFDEVVVGSRSRLSGGNTYTVQYSLYSIKDIDI